MEKGNASPNRCKAIDINANSTPPWISIRGDFKKLNSFIMHLTKTFGQTNKDGSSTTFNIEVDYDPKEMLVKEILFVTVYEEKKRQMIDVTGIFATELSYHLEMIVGSVGWREVWLEQREAA